MMPDKVRKWLRQQSKDFYAAGKAMGQVYQCWWRICQEINAFSRFEYHTFYVLYPFVTYLLTFPRSTEIAQICAAVITPLKLLRSRQCSIHTGLALPISRLCVDAYSALGCVWIWDALPTSSWCENREQNQHKHAVLNNFHPCSTPGLSLEINTRVRSHCPI
jgi:hypothetical protein